MANANKYQILWIEIQRFEFSLTSLLLIYNAAVFELQMSDDSISECCSDRAVSPVASQNVR